MNFIKLIKNVFKNIFFLGNKCDLEEERQVQFQDACNLAKEMGILAALETSAKVILKAGVRRKEKKNFWGWDLFSTACVFFQESQNVEEAFVMMARELMSRNGLSFQHEDINGTPRILLQANSRPVDLNTAAYTPPPEKKSCCWGRMEICGHNSIKLYFYKKSKKKADLFQKAAHPRKILPVQVQVHVTELRANEECLREFFVLIPADRVKTLLNQITFS